MELDDLKKEWQQRDAQLTRQLRVNNHLLRISYLDNHAKELQRQSGMVWVYWVSFIVTVILLGSFIADHITEPRFLMPALLLQIWVIAMHVTHVYLHVALKQIDFSAPLLTVQKELEKIKQWRLMRFKWGFLIGQIVWWVPFIIIVCKGFFDVDLYTINDFMPRFLLMNVLLGLAVVPLSLWISTYVFDRFSHVRLLRRLSDSLSGRDIQASLAFLSRLEEFEKGALNDTGNFS